mgnify:CR=1 FL=1
MPGRETPLITGEIYHIVNRGIASQSIFLNQRDYQRALETILYYQNKKSLLRYSYFIRLQQSIRLEILKKLNDQKDHLLVEIFAYCLMPNHFHLLLKQLIDNGISNYLSKFSNSYTRYFNVKNNRIGPLLQGKFKSVHVDNDEQLLHLSRYIHLNPYSSDIVKSLKGLKEYPYSSLPEYLELDQKNYCRRDLILSYFKTADSYEDFIFSQADSQRELDIIKHHTLEV